MGKLQDMWQYILWYQLLDHSSYSMLESSTEVLLLVTKSILDVVFARPKVMKSHNLPMLTTTMLDHRTKPSSTKDSVVFTISHSNTTITRFDYDVKYKPKVSVSHTISPPPPNRGHLDIVSTIEFLHMREGSPCPLHTDRPPLHTKKWRVAILKVTMPSLEDNKDLKHWR